MFYFILIISSYHYQDICLYSLAADKLFVNTTHMRTIYLTTLFTINISLYFLIATNITFNRLYIFLQVITQAYFRTYTSLQPHAK